MAAIYSWRPQRGPHHLVSESDFETDAERLLVEALRSTRLVKSDFSLYLATKFRKCCSKSALISKMASWKIETEVYFRLSPASILMSVGLFKAIRRGESLARNVA